MPKRSGGLLMYRFRDQILQVLLVHPGGPYWKNKDNGAWSIPKGEAGPTEDLLGVAQREFEEELGHKPDGRYVELAPVKQKGGKVVHAWAFEGDCDPSTIKSNTFAIEWPPKSGKISEFPEVDRAAFFSLEEARKKINLGQAALLDELEIRVASPE
jgi:predicted NUDIX family NTP pyrophosphohydrolase